MIAPDTVRAVKERADIVALVGENVRLRKRGRSFVGLCPFHHEKTPSFHVNAERGFFHCFGCGVSGSAVDYVMQLEGLPFADAIRSLAERLGIPVEQTQSTEEQSQARKRERDRKQLYQVNELAAAYFERQLRTRHPLAAIAREELVKRALPLDSTDEQILAALKSFRIGYAPYGWDGLVSELREQGVATSAAETLGLLVARPGGGGHYDRFRHRLMFAVLDLQGRVVAFSGRALPEPPEELLARLGLSQGRPKGGDDDRGPAKYINSPESPVYVKGDTVFGLQQARHAIRQLDQAILVEGNFDVLALHARGITNVAAPLGTAFTTAQGKLLARYSRNLVLLFDGDAAGTKAVAAAQAPTGEAGLAVKVASLPAGADPDDFVRSQGVEALGKLVAGARGLLDYLIDRALAPTTFEGSSLRGKAARLRAVAQLLAAENDPTVRAMAKAYADRLSAQLVVAGRAPTDLRQLEQMVREAFEHVSRPKPGSTEGAEARRGSPTEQIGQQVLGAILDFPELLEDPAVEEAVTELEGDVALGVAAVRRMWDPQSPFAVSEVLDLMPSAIHAFAASRLASPVFESCEEARAELLENAKKLRRRTWQREKVGMLEQLATAQQRGDSTTEDELLQELARRSRRKLGLT